MKRTSGFLLGALTLAVALPCVVFGSERVTMQSPAKDAAYVSLLPGMVNNHKLKSYLGTAHTTFFQAGAGQILVNPVSRSGGR